MTDDAGLDPHAPDLTAARPDTAEGARMIGGGIGLLLLAVLAILVLVHSGNATETDARSAQERPSSDHPLGTDSTGRDDMARIGLGLRDAARVSLIATGLFGGFAIAMGLVGLAIRQMLPDRRVVRWIVGIAAGLAWLAFVHWLWRLPFVAEVPGTNLTRTEVHGVHDATLAQVSGRLFAVTCIGVAASLALEGIRIGAGHGRRTLRHLVGALTLLFGLGMVSLAVVNSAGMLGLEGPGAIDITGVFAQQHAEGHEGWWQVWPPIAAMLVVLLACALVGVWLMATRSTDIDAVTDHSWHHPTAIILTTLGVTVALGRQVTLSTTTHDVAMRLQHVATIFVVCALVILVVGRVQRGARGLDVSTATWFVLGSALAIVMHWPAQHNLDTTVERELRDRIDAGQVSLDLLHPER
ncbi:MAG: transporter permease [Thermoleophilia bacterium]|nr:transporter permease [Thermoleophilia bacterium]